MGTFLPGLELNRQFYAEVVRPLLDRHAPDLPYAAARVGDGSDVLGFDTEMSTDHNWGPMLALFLQAEDHHLAEDIRRLLADSLPATFRGYPIFFAQSDGPFPVEHWVHPTTVSAFVEETLGFALEQRLTAADWLSFPMQRLLDVTAGAVYHDGTEELTALRQRLAFYPSDVWRYLLAAGWQRIGQAEHLLPRAGIVGDELGSALIGSRLVRDVMTLCFLMERRYAPYPKWFGTAFARLACAPNLTPLLWQAQMAPAWPERNEALVAASEYLVRMHNALGITAPLPERATPFHGRPFTVIHGESFVPIIQESVTDPAVLALFSRRPLGGIDLISDNIDLLVDPGYRLAVRALYEQP
ncbi:MAG: DUF4037 domain-containing protein [Chloroflexia bacterium]|nr:DUF4037 domain-containing protein [Chloroflexia bacterium]